MNKDTIFGATSSTSSDLQVCPEDIFRQSILNVRPFTANKTPHQQNPRKKRTKMIRVQNMNAIVGVGVGSSSQTSKPKYGKKPDPSAPKITRPCSECGKRFWSWKALFGHMRCHPERPWRGLNPPVNPPENDGLTDEDRYVASCLLMLANGSSRIGDHEQGGSFECASCKKVFGSHQALGGHRASHKNVKGCFANTRNEGGEEVEEGELEGEHKCSICLRAFSSGQALGGHKRCHWEKEAASTSFSQIFDLNLPAPQQDDDDSSCSSLGGCLDLRLGL